MKGLVCLLCLLIASPALAQTDSATAVGTTRDNQGGTLAGVTITLKNVGTGFARETTTTPDGRYRLGAILPGDYELTAARSGFKTVIRKSSEQRQRSQASR